MQHARSGMEQCASGMEWDRYQSVRSRSLQLVEGLTAEDCQVQSMPDVSPAKWHLAHTSWFFETFVLAECGVGYAPFDAQFAYLFNSYYNSLGPMHPRPQRGLLTRPSLQRVMDYRQHVDAAMAQHWRAIVAAGLGERIELGLQHEQQHQELMLTDILHVLGCNPLAPAYDPASPPASMAQPSRWQRFGAGVRWVGHSGEGFAFDNERPRHRVWTEAFEVATRPVTNAEYRAFMDDGGYRNPLLWLSDGWAQRQAGDWQRPLYWDAPGEQAFGLYGLRPLDPHAPVSHLSYYEADAYARWAGARLPTEAEWETALTELGLPTPALPRARCPVLRAGLGAGEVWEWTCSAYAAYPGFRASAGAVGEYNGKFMCNQFVLRGGSCATPPGHARLTYRNFFPPAARWQFSGLRLARDA